MDKKTTMTGKMDFHEALAADGCSDGVEREIEERDQREPFDPEKIAIDTKVLTVDALIQRLLQGTVRLAPVLQRKETWDLTGESQLIESLMLNIPIPMFYVAADERGHWDVVDGLQRLTTMQEFILGAQYLKTKREEDLGKGFQLENLEFWGARCSNLSFAQLPEFLKKRILETEFSFTIVNPGTPEEIKRKIFKRINTRGMPLTSQEIRHALYHGRSTRLLEELAQSPEFKRATGESVNDGRMAARELVLRFLAFSIRHHSSYPASSDMDKFLSDTMRLLNIMPELPHSKLLNIFKGSDAPEIRFRDAGVLKKRFADGMQRAYKLFGEHCFRKSAFGNDNVKKTPVNKTLFEVYGNLLADMDDNDFNSLMNNRAAYLEDCKTMFQNQGIGEVIFGTSWKSSSVRVRYLFFQDKLAKHI